MTHLHARLTALLFLAFSCCAPAQTPFPLQAQPFDSHVELSWSVPVGTSPFSYKIWRAAEGQDFAQVKIVFPTDYLDFPGHPGDSPDTHRYFVQALGGAGVLATSDTIEVTLTAFSDEALMDMVQRYTFRYFWDFGHPVSGMARERNSSGDVVTSGGTGFGIMALLVGIERGFITRQEGLERLTTMTAFLENDAERFHGVFPHWLNGATGQVVPFSQFDNGGDLVETAFLMQGLLCARQYFNLNDPAEQALRASITSLWEAVEWDWYRKNNSNVLYWHWSPNFGWQMNFQVRGYNEALIIYLLAIASPTHPVPASLWHSGWAGGNYENGQSYYGYPLEVGPARGGPLFFAHYSYIGFNPKGIKDEYANYYIHNKHHSLVNRAYCAANPENHEGYSGDCWGLTASDDPWGYLAHEPSGNQDNGTISPTAALSSMPWTPAESMTALKHFYRVRGEKLWSRMGFFDAFNLDEDWYASSTLAIDQGPIICMIENHRSGLLWNLFMSNPEIQPALDSIGFMEDLTPAAPSLSANAFELLAFPNPASETLRLEFVLESAQPVSVALLDAQGRTLRQVLDGERAAAGLFSREVGLEGLAQGLYFLTVRKGVATAALRVTKM